MLKFYCPIHQKRVRKNCGTRDRREARRIQREDAGLTPEVPIEEFTTLESMGYLWRRLREGDEGLYDHRAPPTVNTMMGAVMAFVRFYKTRGWILDVPPLEKLSVDDVIKGGRSQERSSNE